LWRLKRIYADLALEHRPLKDVFSRPLLARLGDWNESGDANRSRAQRPLADRRLRLWRSARQCRPRVRDVAPLIAAMEGHVKVNSGQGFGLLLDGSRAAVSSNPAP
jgi:hypothetical protein